MATSPEQAVLACLPTDRARIEALWAVTGLPMEECPKPTDLYTLGNCAYCNCSIWVGPRQLQMSKDMGIETWCYFCAGAKHGPDAPVSHLGGGHLAEGVSRW